MIENLNMSGEIYIGDFGEYSTGVDITALWKRRQEFS